MFCFMYCKCEGVSAESHLKYNTHNKDTAFERVSSTHDSARMKRHFVKPKTQDKIPFRDKELFTRI